MASKHTVAESELFQTKPAAHSPQEKTLGASYQGRVTLWVESSKPLGPDEFTSPGDHLHSQINGTMLRPAGLSVSGQQAPNNSLDALCTSESKQSPECCSHLRDSERQASQDGLRGAVPSSRWRAGSESRRNVQTGTPSCHQQISCPPARLHSGMATYRSPYSGQHLTI